jgi:hypothetical protein
MSNGGSRVSGSSGRRHGLVAPKPEGALIIYGRGAELGDFSIFARSLQENLKKTYRNHIIVKHIEKKKDFFNYLETTSFKFYVKELHIFSHSFGAGLALGYRSQEGRNSRMRVYQNALNEGRSVTYEEVLKAEVGIIFTDDLINFDKTKQTKIRKIFSKQDAFIKIWGCNAGVAGWIYTDDPGQYYWQALNTKNTPKPSIAKAIASFFNVKVWAAYSGSHIEVFFDKKWITTDEYKRQYGSYPPGNLPHRLHPDKGDYKAYEP